MIIPKRLSFDLGLLGLCAKKLRPFTGGGRANYSFPKDWS